MLSASSTTSSSPGGWRRLLRTAAPWTVLAVVLVELAASQVLPLGQFANPTEEALALVEARQFQSQTLLIGDSVAAQLSQDSGLYLSLATDGSLETTGQHLLVRRYLARNPGLKHVVLISSSPLMGDLDQVFTENSVQRCFLGWREMAALSWMKRDLSFGLTMLKYRLLPTNRHRHSIREALLPGLDRVLDLPPSQEKRQARLKARGKAWTVRLARWLAPHRQETLAADSLERMAHELNRQGIKLVVLRGALPQSAFKRYEANHHNADLEGWLGRLAREVPTFSYHLGLVYPDDAFMDGVHLRADQLERVRQDYHELLRKLLR